MKYVWLDEDNSVIMIAGEGRSLPEGAIEIVTDVQTRLLTNYHVVEQEGEISLLPRPRLAEMTVENGTYTILNIPLGTNIEVIDLLGGETISNFVTDVNDYNLEFQIDGSGEFEISLHPPLPYMFVKHTVKAEV